MADKFTIEIEVLENTMFSRTLFGGTKWARTIDLYDVNAKIW